MFNRILISFVLFIFSCSVSAQVSVQFIPEVYGRSMDGLMSARLLNTGGKQNVRLLISVTENKAGKILNILTQPFTIIPGSNQVPSTAVRSASIQMGNNSLAQFIQRNGHFPQGYYEYSYKVISAIAIDEIIVDQIFEQEVLPPAPLNLIEPFNEEKICNKMPVLSWQPSIPVIAGTMYELLLVEIKDRQSPVEALNYNLPVVKQKGIPNPILVYPASSKELAEGKRYAWQVTAYKDQTIINRSEVWEFTFSCKEEKEPVKDDNGYRDIDDLARGNYYIAQGVVKFAVINSYIEQKLKYEVHCITDPGSKVRGLPKIKLLKGQNKVELDFSRNFSFKDNYSYILKVYLPNGTAKSLRFIYKDLE
jgi:hypothetical protein